MTKANLLAALAQSTETVMAAFSNLTPEDFRKKPAADAWSPAQLAEHLLKVDVSTNKALTSEAVATNRPPDQKIALIQQVMEDNTKRMAPERVHPSATAHDPHRLLAEIRQQRQAMKEAILSSDMTEACTNYKHPALGTLTKMEWVAFNIYHAERHLRQLQARQANPSA